MKTLRVRGERWAGALVLAASVCGVRVAEAEVPQALLLQLAPYDTEGSRSFDALQALTDQASATQSRADRAELSFLHTMASTDLWLIAEARDDAALRQRVADHLGVQPADVPGVLSDALAGLHETLGRESLDDAQAAVRMLAQPGDGPLTRAESGEGTRASLAYLTLAARRTDAGGVPSMEQLAALSEDPCAAVSLCEDPYARFDPQGRAAVVTLQRLHAALARLSHVQPHDPLVSALHDEIESRFSSFEGTTFRPGPRLTEGPQCATSEVCGEAAAPDVIVFVEAGRVRMGFVPGVRFDRQAGIELVAAGSPMWPEARTVEAEWDLPPYLRALGELTRPLEEMRAGRSDLRLAVGADERTRAHFYARVLLSVRAAGFDDPWALGRTAEGYARVQPLRVVPAPAADRLEPGELNVMMLMKGYSVRRWGPSVSIDNKTGQDGASHFDVPALLSRARDGRAARSSYLRFVPYVGAGDLVSTTFAVAPQDQRVTLILP